MNSIPSKKPSGRLNIQWIHPGPVGSVGDTLMNVRLKSSLAGNFSWDAEYYGKRESLYGSSISNGGKVSFNSGGGPARVRDSNWGGRRSFSTNHGWYYQDTVAPDKLVEPEVGALPQYQWRNRIASVQNAKRTGNLFMPLPTAGYPQDGLPRGGSMPRVTDVAGGGTVPGYEDDTNPFSNAPNFHPQASSVTSGPDMVIGAPKGRTSLGRMNRS